jgi:glycosyltransferase involved in cell wall biosynthesis
MTQDETREVSVPCADQYDHGLTRPTISVTMAAYNVAPFVAASLDSILAQEWTDFELIVVDDSSTDSTREILQNYAARDSRIRLFLKDRNEGLSVARNLALAQARGDWVAFLDADDLYSPDMLRLAIEAGRAQSAEMVLWDYIAFSDEREIGTKSALPSSLAQIVGSDRLALLNRPAFAWTRLVRRDVLARLQINFPPGLTYQDVLVHWQLITQLDRVALVPKRLAYYRQQPQATTAGNGMRRADYFIVLDMAAVFLRDTGLFDTFEDILTARELNAWHGVYDVVAEEHRSRVDEMIAERFGDRHRAYLAAKRPLRWQARAFYAARDGDRFSALRLWLRSTARSCYRCMKARG